MNTFHLIRILVVYLSLKIIKATLLFPASSVLQITASVAAPVEIPGRRLYWDWGFQINFDLPYNLKQFSNVPIWPDNFEDRKRRTIDMQKENNINDWRTMHLKYKNWNFDNDDKHSSDFSAGELYHSFENLLLSYGFHETCLMRSVCELARHPFADDQQNILIEILTFILTPSIHKAFSSSEFLYRDVYEEAEQRGFLGHNCAELYFECKQDLLTSITNIINKNIH